MKWIVRAVMRYLAKQFLNALFEVADEMSAIETVPAAVQRVREQRRDPRITHD